MQWQVTALENISHKTMRRMMKGNPEAVLSVQLAISHSLDVLAAARMITALEIIHGNVVPYPATLVSRAEAAIKQRYANDKAPSIRVWPDLGVMASEYYRHQTEKPLQSALPILSGAVGMRITVAPSARSWNNVIRAATPGWEGLLHE